MGFFLVKRRKKMANEQKILGFFFFFGTGLTTFDLDKDVHFRIMHLLWKMVTLFTVNKVCKNVDETPHGVQLELGNGRYFSDPTYVGEEREGLNPGPNYRGVRAEYLTTRLSLHSHFSFWTKFFFLFIYFLTFGKIMETFGKFIFRFFGVEIFWACFIVIFRV